MALLEGCSHVPCSFKVSSRSQLQPKGRTNTSQNSPTVCLSEVPRRIFRNMKNHGHREPFKKGSGYTPRIRIIGPSELAILEIPEHPCYHTRFKLTLPLEGPMILTLPSSKLTWQWKILMFNREYIFNRAIFHFPVSFARRYPINTHF